MTTTTTITKRGRKAGSGSFVSIPLSELNSVLKPTAMVVVWSRYADALSLSGRKVFAKADQLISSVEGGKSAPLLEVFDDPIKDAISVSPAVPTPAPTFNPAIPAAPVAFPSGEKPDLVPRPSVHLTEW